MAPVPVPRRVGDLVEATPVRPVVRLADLGDDVLRRQLASGFVATADAEHCLSTVLGDVRSRRGRGYFLEGHYGTGKSHLLAMLGLMLSPEGGRASVAAVGPGAVDRAAPGREGGPPAAAPGPAPAAPGAAPAATGAAPAETGAAPAETGAAPAATGALAASAGGPPLLVVPVSLVEHAGREVLEDVVRRRMAACAARLGAGPAPEPPCAGPAPESPGAGPAPEPPCAGPAPEPPGAGPAPEPPDAGAAVANVRQTPALPLPVSAGDAPASAGAPPPRLEGPRREAFGELTAWVAARGLGGVCLLLDELSEFLRAKPDGPAFHEDVRFLQYLGEWAEDAPAWIVCAVQEAVERAGDLPPDVFARIRDRYPVRFRLSGRHVRELVARRLIRRLPGAEAAIEELYRRLVRAFGGVPFSREDFVALYPLHPATVEALEAMRHLFSQQRGVVDFVHHRVAGDPARRLPALLDQPADRLICPDAIVDHFRDRLREQPETNLLATVALPYFEREIPRLFADPEAARLALRMAMLLVLAAAAPTPRRLTAREVRDSLLHRITDLDPALNHEAVREGLDRLVSSAAYIVCDPAAPGGPGEDRYSLDLQADVAAVVRRRLDFLLRSLGGDDPRCFSHLAEWCDDPAMPLAALHRTPRAVREVQWGREARQAAVWLAAVDELEPRDARDLARTVETSEVDAVVLIAVPSPDGGGRERDRWVDRLAPVFAAAAGAPPAAVCWLPRAATAAERVVLREALGYRLLAEEEGADTSPAGRQMQPYLARVLPEVRGAVRSLYRTLYMEGEVVDAFGNLARPAALGVLPFDSLLARLLDTPLRSRFPRRIDGLRAGESVPPATLARAIGQLAAAGQVESDPEADPALHVVAEQVMVPLGLARRTARGYRLTVDGGGSPVVAEVLAQLGGARPAAPLAVADLYWRLRKGPFGLPRRGFDALLLTLVRAGAAAAYRGGRRLPPGQATAANLWDLGLAPGELLSEPLQAALAAVDFLPAGVRRVPLTYNLQREAWDALVAWRRGLEADLRQMRAELASTRDFAALRPLSGGLIGEEMSRADELLAAVQVSLPAQEGLQRFLVALQSRPHAERTVHRLRRLRSFLDDDLNRFLFMAGYVSSDALALPPDHEDLAVARAGLLQAFQDPLAAMEPDAWTALEASFAGFREGYAAAYAEAHEAEVGPAVTRPYGDLRRSAAYRVLAALDSVPGLSAQPDRVAVDRAIDESRAGSCPRAHDAVLDALRSLPACACGFRPDRPVRRAELAVLRRLCAQAAAVHLRELRAPRCADRLLGHRTALRELGRGEADGDMDAVLALDPAGPLGEAEAALVERAAPVLREALAGSALVVERDLGRLAARLDGRLFAPDQLLAAVGEWLAGPEGRGGVYIRVRWGGRGSAGGRGGSHRGASRLAAPDDPAGAPAPAPSGGADASAAPSSGPRGEPAALGHSTARSLAGAEPDPLDVRRLVAILRRDPDAAQLRAVLAEAGAALERWGGRVRGGGGLAGAAAQACHAAARFLLALDGWRAAAARPPADAPTWERLFSAAPAHGERWLAEAHDAARRAGLALELPFAVWASEWREAGRLARSAFAARCPGWMADPPASCLTIERLWPEVTAPWAALPRDHPGAFAWLVDALRLDLLPVLLEELAAGGACPLVRREGILWSHAPTVTRVQLEALRGAGFRGDVYRWDDGCLDAVQADPEGTLEAVDWARGARGRGCLCCWGFLDDKVHTSREDYGTFLAEFRDLVRRRLLPAFAALRPGAAVLLLSDHGFVANPAYPFSDRYTTPRYLHGGPAPEEVLAPWVLLGAGAPVPALSPPPQP